MLPIHLHARTAPALGPQTARSHASSGVRARRYGVSNETVRKWRRRGRAACQDHSAQPHKLALRASDEGCYPFWNA